MQLRRHKVTLHVLLTSCSRYRHSAAATALPTVCQALYLHTSQDCCGVLQERFKVVPEGGSGAPAFSASPAQASQCTTKQEYIQQDTPHTLPSGLQCLNFSAHTASLACRPASEAMGYLYLMTICSRLNPGRWQRAGARLRARRVAPGRLPAAWAACSRRNGARPRYPGAP